MLKAIKKNVEDSGRESSPEEMNEIEKEDTDEKAIESTEAKDQTEEPKQEIPVKAMKFPRPKPNFFLAVQVNDAGIHEKVKKLQEKVITKNSLLKPAIVNVSTLHVTLAVTHLANKTDIETVKKKLDEWAAQNIKAYFDSPCVLSFKGVNTFKSGVAYVEIEESPSLKKLSDLSQDLNNILSSSGYFTERKSFKPHLTFLKLSKSTKLLKKKRRFDVDFELLRNSDDFFGQQEINELQLLSMDYPKDECGYYQCFHKIAV